MTKKMASAKNGPSNKRICALIYLAIAINVFILIAFLLSGIHSIGLAQGATLFALSLLLSCLTYTALVLNSKPEKATAEISNTTIVLPAEANDALAAIPDLIWSIDYANRRVTAQNHKLNTKHPSGMEQNKIASLFPARVSRQYLECLIKIQNTQAPQRFEYTLDSDDITYEARLSTLDSRNCLVIIRDISSTKATEAALFQQQMFTQQILDANPSLIFVRDTHSRFLLVNQATQALLGHDLLVQSHMGLDEDTSILTAGDAEVLQYGNTVRLEDHCTLVSGRTHWFDLTKIPLEREGQVYILTIAIDITHLKESEQAQAGTGNLVRAMADVLPQPFLLIENDIVQFANFAACERLGLTPETLIGEKASKLTINDEAISELTQIKNHSGDTIHCTSHKVDRGNQNTHLIALH